MAIDLKDPLDVQSGPIGPSTFVTAPVSPNGPWGVSIPSGTCSPNLWSQLNFNFSGQDDSEEETNPDVRVEPRVKIDKPICSDCKLDYPYAEVYDGDTFICKGCQLLLDTWT